MEIEEAFGDLADWLLEDGTSDHEKVDNFVQGLVADSVRESVSEDLLQVIKGVAQISFAAGRKFEGEVTFSLPASAASALLEALLNS